MKLKTIRFCNINSLKGTHTVDFENGPIADAGLFAITGPTGSGKSTLLDVITLALYNTVPRLGKISKTSIEKMGSIVTHYTNEAWAEIEYEIKGRSYRSRWSISKARTGNFRDYDMELIALPEEMSLGLKKGEVPSENERLIGLTYDQFMKSILLSQGEFSKFLQAKKDERAQLLEEITGTHIYRDLGKLAFEKVKEKLAEVNTLKERKAMVLLLPELEEERLTNELNNYQQKQKRHIKEIGFLKQLIDYKQQKRDIDDLELLINKHKQQLKTLEEEGSSRMELYKKHLKAKKYEESIHGLDQTIIEINRIRYELEQNESILASSIKSKQDAIDSLSELTQSEVKEKNFYDQMSTYERKVTDLDAALISIKQKGLELRQRLKELCRNSNLEISNRLDVTYTEGLEIIEQRKKSISKSKKSSRDQLQIQYQNAQKHLTESINYANHLNGQYRNLLKTQELAEQRKKSDAHINEYLNEERKVTNTIKEIENDLERIKKQLEQAQNNANLDDYRHALIDGEPCPLCGSTHHPATHDKILSDIGLLSLSVKKKDDEYKKILEQLSTIKSNLRVENHRIIQLDKEIKKVNEESEDINSLIAQSQKLYTPLANITIENWPKIKSETEQKISELQNHIQTYDEVDFLQRAESEFQKLAVVATEYKEKNSERMSIFKGTEIAQVLNPIQNKFTQATTNINSVINRNKKSKTDLKEAEKQKEYFNKTLMPLVTMYALDNSQDCKSLLLSNEVLSRIQLEREEILKIDTQIKNETSRLAKLNEEWLNNFTKLSSLEKTQFDQQSLIEIQESLRKRETESNEILQEIGIIIEKIRNNEVAKKRINLLDNELTQLQGDNEIWILLKELIGDAKGKTFSNYAQNLTLSHLLQRANIRLSNLSDRYLLSFKPAEEDLLVIDKYQGDTIRAVKTLSGGETFLLSLALALSLSDFASKHVHLESLFIDEGFGTLDQETLDIAMNTLEKLQHESGKKIGIISHVESLKERINTQIKVHKNAHGYSQLEIVN